MATRHQMMSGNSTAEPTNQFGETDRIYAYTVWVTTAQQLISIVAVIFNMALVYITLKHKALHKIYGHLLAICCLCDVLTEAATPLATVLTFLRVRIPLLTCCFAQWFAVAGSINSYWNLFFISLDRMAALFFPIFYRRNFTKQTSKYAIWLNLGSLVVVAYNLYVAFVYAAKYPEIMVYCDPGDMFQGEALNLAGHMMMAVTALTMLIYVAMGVALKTMKKETSNNGNSQMDVTRRIFKSLVMIMAVIFVCWFISGTGITTLVPMLTADPALQFLYGRLIIQLNTLAGMANAPVLYLCSTEYRNIMREEFRLIRWLSGFQRQEHSPPDSTAVTPQQVANQQPIANIVVRTLSTRQNAVFPSTNLRG